MQELRTSERKSFGDCPQQWFWGYVEELTPIRPATALWFGIHWHDAMAKWYLRGTARGIHPAEYLHEVINTERKIYVTNEAEEDEFIKAHDLAVAMGEGYVKEYGRDEQWEILAIESQHAVIWRNHDLRYLFCVDGLYRDLETGEIFILEHKTAKAIRVTHLRLDNQAGSYYALAPIVFPLADLLKPGEKIAGIQYNFARKAIPNDDKPRDRNGQVTNKPTKAHYVAALKGKPIHLLVGNGYGALGEVQLSRYNLDDLERIAAKNNIRVLGDVSKVQPAPYFVRPDPVYRTREERQTQLRRIVSEAHYMNRMRSGDPNFPVIKTPGDHCGWCAFRDMCELDEYDKAAAEGFKATRMMRRDPYEQYRKVA